MGLMRAHGSSHGINTGTHNGGWLANHHRCLQAMGGWAHPEDMMDDVSLARPVGI